MESSSRSDGSTGTRAPARRTTKSRTAPALAARDKVVRFGPPLLTAALLGCAAAGADAPPRPTERRERAAPPRGFDRFARRWEAPAPIQVEAIAFSRDGDVLTLAENTTDLYSGRDGSPLRSLTEGCPILAVAPDGAAAFLVVCPETIRRVDLATLEHEVLHTFREPATNAAISAREIYVAVPLVGPGRPRVLVLDRATRAVRAELPTGELLPSALAANEAGLLVAAFPTGVWIRKPGAASLRKLVEGTASRVVAPSGDGALVYFGTPEPLEGLAVQVDTAEVAARWRGSAPAGVAWLGRDAVAFVGGSPAIRVVELAGTEAWSTHDEEFDVVASREDGSALCAHSQEASKLACYFTAKRAPPP